MNAPWRIELLGWLRAENGAQVVSRFRSQQTGALLAYLAYYCHRSHPRDVLIELLWPECDWDAGRNRLRVALSSLRRQLEPPGVPPGAVLVTDRATLRLNPAACVTDVSLFEAALQAAARAAGAERAQYLAEAVALYRGELLPGYFEEWILPERLRLADEHQRAVCELIAHCEQEGDRHAALQWARRSVAADPLRAESRHELIRLLVAQGQVEASLRQFQELEDLLAREWGSAPPPETRALIAGLGERAGSLCGLAAQRHGEVEAGRLPQRRRPEQAKPPMALESAPSVVSAAPQSSGEPDPSLGSELLSARRWPLQFTRFFGREAEIDRLCRLLATADPSAVPCRLVTLTGPGGTGKTRLALAAGEQLRAAFPGGAWFVPLADLVEARYIPDKVLAVLGLGRVAAVDLLEQIAAALAPRDSPGTRCLLVLDNFEHLVDDGAPLVQRLMERAPALSLLVTSRQRLGLPGEREFPVEPLPVPGVQGREEDPEPLTTLVANPSVRLFVDRAQAARADFQVTPGNAAVIAAVCARLEGIPLALELAAARARVLTPAQMLTRLEQRLELLVSRGRVAEPRHRSLRAALDGSFHLLTPDLQRFFAMLSVFRGGWTLEAAEAMAESREGILDGLEELRDVSLVAAAESGNREMRYRMLETVREYAAEQVDPEQRAALARRHAAYYRAMVEGAEMELLGPGQASWLATLDLENENFRAALDWSAESGEVEEGLLLAGGLWGFWWVRGHLEEGRQRLARLLARGPAETTPGPARARALACAGVLAHFQSDYAAARAAYEESLTLQRRLGDRWGMAFALTGLAFIALRHGDPNAARALQAEGLPLWRELDNRAGIAWSLNSLADVAHQQGDLERAWALFEESLAIRRELGDDWGAGFALNGMGLVAGERGDWTTARALLEESLTIRRRLGDRPDIVLSLQNLGDLAHRQGDYPAAVALYEEGLALQRQMGHPRGVAASQATLGHICMDQGETTAARVRFDDGLAILRGLATPEREAATLYSLSLLATRLAQEGRVRPLLVDSLRSCHGPAEREGIAAGLAGLSALVVGRAARESSPRPSGENRDGVARGLEIAGRLFGAAEGALNGAEVRLPPPVRAQHQAIVAAARALPAGPAFAAAWDEGRAIGWEAAAATALREFGLEGGAAR